MDKKQNEANFFWSGDLSIYELANLKSFEENGFIVNVWIYLNDNKTNLNELQEFNVKDANEILDISMLKRFTQGNQKANLSSFSNIFRFQLLKTYGGWWFDSDCICLKNVDEFVKLANENEFVIGREYEDYTGSSVLFFNETNILDIIIKEVWGKIEEKEFNFFWGEIGPNLISEIFLRDNLMSSTFDETYFYKISADKFYLLFDNKNNEMEQYLNESYVCHYWNEMLNRSLIKKDTLPPEGSYMYKHLDRHIATKDNLRTYGKIFFLRFNPLFKFLVRLFFRIKVIIKNFSNR